MATSPPQLKPLSPGEIIDEAIDLLRSNWRLFFGIAAVVEFPTTLLSRILFRDPHMYGSHFWLIFVLIAPGYLAVVAVTAAATKRHLGSGATLPQCYRFACARPFALVGTALATWLMWAPVLLVLGCMAVPLGVAIGLAGHGLSPYAQLAWLFYAGAAIFIVIAAFWDTWLSLIYPAFVAEGCSGFGAVRRSWRLIQARYWPSYAVVVVSEVIAGSVQWGLLWLAKLIPGPKPILVPITALLAALLGATALPLRAVPRLILYYDLRVRKEGYDLQLLSQGDTPPPPLLQPQDALSTVPDPPQGTEEGQNA